MNDSGERTLAYPPGKGFMHRLMAGVTILEHELSELRLLVERQTGILLDCPNSALAAHVAEYLEAHELESPAALMGHLRAADQDPSALPTFLDGVLNSNTGFFRHPGAMNALARQVIPQLYARKSNDGPSTLRIWSAGCSTGEEAYSIAMALCEALPAGNGSGNANGSSNGTTGKDAKDKDTKEKCVQPQWRDCGDKRPRFRRDGAKRLVDSHCRQRSAAFRHRSRRAGALSAVGA